MGGRGASSASATARQVAPGSPMTIEQAMAATNPNFKRGREWQENCQRCVYAYEMNRRGILCQAKPRILNGHDTVAANWSRVFNGQTWQRVGSRSANKVIDNLDKSMAGFGDGSRAVVYVTWKGGRSAHVFNAERLAGKTRYVDPQSGKMVNIQDYISRSMPTRTMVSRIDNLTPTRLIEDCIERR